MGQGYHGGTGPRREKMSEAGCVLTMLTAFAFPFIVYGLVTLSAYVGESFGTLAGLVVWFSPIWMSVVAAVVASSRRSAKERAS